MIRVLLVDDDQELCALQHDYLSREGFAVTVCHDGTVVCRPLARGSLTYCCSTRCYR